MMRRQRILSAGLPALGLILMMVRAPAADADVLRFDAGNSLIDGSIKYAMIGRYRAGFENYSGKIIYDPEKKEIKSVDLEIEAAAIKSAHPSLDRVVRSAKILDVKTYPEVNFTSTVISKTGVENEYRVVGTLEMHGVQKEIELPFTAEWFTTGSNTTGVTVSGSWVIPRKDYGIVWHSLFDRAGILVGNHMTIDWKISSDPERAGIGQEGGKGPVHWGEESKREVREQIPVLSP